MYYMSPFILQNHERQIYRDRKQISGCQGLRRKEHYRGGDEHTVSFRCAECVLKSTLVMDTQLCDYPQSHVRESVV